MDNNENTNDKSARCVVCAELIPVDALKCSKCNSYQDKRRFIFQWSGLFTALIALAPFWAMALSLWNIAFPGTPDIKISAACQEKEIAIYVANKGGQAAALGNPKMFEIRENKTKASNTILKTSEKDLILNPGDIRKLVWIAVSGGVEGSYFPMRDSDEKCQLKISFPIIDFQEPGKTADAYCDCPE